MGSISAAYCLGNTASRKRRSGEDTVSDLTGPGMEARPPHRLRPAQRLTRYRCRGRGSNPGAVKSDTVSSATLNRCDSSLQLCWLSTTSRKWDPPLVNTLQRNIARIRSFLLFWTICKIPLIFLI